MRSFLVTNRVENHILLPAAGECHGWIKYSPKRVRLARRAQLRWTIFSLGVDEAVSRCFIARFYLRMYQVYIES